MIADWEARTKTMLDRCLIQDVLAVQVADFCTQFQMQPTLVVMHIKLKGALVREVFQASGNEADIDRFIVEPVWLGALPMIFSDIGEHYIKVKNNGHRKQLTL